MSRYNDPIVKLSKALSYVLRHGAVKEGIPIQADGYVSVQDLLKRPQFQNCTLEQIQHVVDNNDKKRFTLTNFGAPKGWMIKANQGHSIEVEDLSLQLITDPKDLPVAVHGTDSKSWSLIEKSGGLSRMRRNHIHMAVGLPGDNQVISGMRRSCDVYIFINVPLAMKDGFEFYRSENNVILSPGKGPHGVIPLTYFERVESRSGEVIFAPSK